MLNVYPFTFVELVAVKTCHAVALLTVTVPVPVLSLSPVIVFVVLSHVLFVNT